MCLQAAERALTASCCSAGVGSRTSAVRGTRLVSAVPRFAIGSSRRSTQVRRAPISPGWVYPWLCPRGWRRCRRTGCLPAGAPACQPIHMQFGRPDRRPALGGGGGKAPACTCCRQRRLAASHPARGQLARPCSSGMALQRSAPTQLPRRPPLPPVQRAVTQAVAQVDAKQQISLDTSGAADATVTDMAKVRAAHACALRRGGAASGVAGRQAAAVPCRRSLRAAAGRLPARLPSRPPSCASSGPPRPCSAPSVPPQTVLGIILGGGAGSRLYPLTKKRAKPAVPLGANYRLIDIPVSNCINSGAPACPACPPALSWLAVDLLGQGGGGVLCAAVAWRAGRPSKFCEGRWRRRPAACGVAGV